MTTSRIQVTEGSGKNLATRSISEDAVTKEIQRVEINDEAGVAQNAIGVTTGAAVITDADGTIQQYLRGLVKLFITSGSALVTAIVGGNVAHDAADSGNPIKTGVKALTAEPTAVTANDRANAMGDTLGRQVVLNGSLAESRLDGKANYTNTTAADVIAAQGAGVKIVVTSVLVVNAHASVGTKVEIRDGTTVKIQGHAAKDGGGFYLHDSEGLFRTTANAAVTARCVTTGADVDVFITGYKSAI